MKTLHIFNPEHDIALAANLSHFTAPHAGRQLRADLGWLPALWAEENDYILVEHVDAARKAYERLRKKLGRPIATFVSRHELPHLDIQQVNPWGWDAAVATDLFRWGIKAAILPDEELLAHYRQLSHRRTSAQLLPALRLEGTVGEALECATLEQVKNCQERWGQIVIKSPWSSSGRGVRFAVQEGWINNVIKAQGSVMVEPYYNKVKDFGMEFEVDQDGKVHYLGLSLFHTKNGAYIGNLLATEQAKREQLSRYVSMELLDDIKQRIIDNVQLPDYVGPFGIDMMIVNGHRSPLTAHRSPLTANLLLHPCVELNLRRTMGHVALNITPSDDDHRKVMRIELTDHYKLSIRLLR